MGQKQKPSGNNILQLARKHLGEKYVFGVVAPKNNLKWKRPWDCAEFWPPALQTAQILSAWDVLVQARRSTIGGFHGE